MEIAEDPILFDDFFELGQEETASPFITPESRKWGANLSLKTSLLAAGLLTTSFALSYFPHYLPISYFLLMIVYFLVGIPSLIESIEDIVSGEINIDVLMTLAAFSSVMIGSAMEGGLLLVLFAVSGAMEEFVTRRAKDSISSLHKISPTKVCVIQENGTIIERSIRDVDVGTPIWVKPGQIVPLDGIVIHGISSVNLVHLTGENLPVTKKIGDIVPAGSRNMEGALTLRVSHTSSDSSLARIIQLVTQAQEERPVLQKWFDRLSKGYAMSIISFSAVVALTLPFLIGIPFLCFEGSVYRALAFLIAASPCALIIAIPIAYLSAIGACARKGILLKGGVNLDALANCSIIAFDKTGTLTTGDLTLEAIEGVMPSSARERQEALAVAYALEKHAVHPIARAIVAHAQEFELPIVATDNFQVVPGYGLQCRAKVNDELIDAFVGHPDYVLNKLPEEIQQRFEKLAEKPRKNGEIIATLLLGNKLYLLRFKDTLRSHIQETVASLKHKNKRLAMLTGDHEESARRIAKELGIDEYRANLKPEDKLDHVTSLASQGGLAMVGDGINDAPALARATVGICMGKIGSTPAIDAAEIILLQDNIESLGWLFDKAHQTKRIVRQNLILAACAIVIASIPALGGMIPLWLAVVMHEGGTVLVGLNGLRLLK